MLLAACGDKSSDGETGSSDSSTTSSTTPAETPDAGGQDTNGLDGGRPPVEAKEFEPLIGEALAGLGLALTNRGGLIDTRNGQYTQSPDGNHVALYAEPVSDSHTDDQYIDGILETAKLSAPTIFERWSTIETYDICQESPAGRSSYVGVPATQIYMTAEQSAAVDWDTLTLVELIAATLTTPPTIERLTVTQKLQSQPRYIELLDEAKQLAG